MKKKIFLIISLISTLYSSVSKSNPPFNYSWYDILTAQNENEQDNALKHCMKSHILSWFLKACSTPEQANNATLLFKIITTRMNANKSEVLTKDSIANLLTSFNRTGSYTRSRSLDNMRSAMTITDKELDETKQHVLQSLSTGEKDGLLQAVFPTIPECKMVPECENPDEPSLQRLKKKIANKIVTEDQVIACLHVNLLIKALASTLAEANAIPLLHGA